jgi:hypothetical protein
MNDSAPSSGNGKAPVWKPGLKSQCSTASTIILIAVDPQVCDHTVRRKAELLAAYRIAAFNAKLLEKPYWFWEQRRGRLADLLENEGGYP